MPATEVLCPHDAEEVEKILREVRRTNGAATNSRPLPPIRGWKSFQLHDTTLGDSRRGCFLLSAEEREVVICVVSELEEFGGLEGSKTAEQQSDQRSEDESGAHFKARWQGTLIQHAGTQLNGSKRTDALIRWNPQKQRPILTPCKRNRRVDWVRH